MPRRAKDRDALASVVLTYQAVTDYRAGASIRKIADKYGYPYNDIRKILLDAGVELRKVGRYRGD